MTYLLDANVLAYFWNVNQQQALATAAAKVSLAAAEAVKDELERAPKYGSRFKNWIGTTAIAVVPIIALSDVHTHLLALQPDPTKLKDKGERASIAIAGQDPNFAFVANDKAALWLALHELHQREARIIGVRVFLRRMYEETQMAPNVIDEVARAAQGPVPTWWNDWRRSIESPSHTGSRPDDKRS